MEEIFYGIYPVTIDFAFEKCLRKQNYRIIILCASLKSVCLYMEYISQFYHKVCRRIFTGLTNNFLELTNGSAIRILVATDGGKGVRANLLIADELVDRKIVEDIYKPCLIKYENNTITVDKNI